MCPRSSVRMERWKITINGTDRAIQIMYKNMSTVRLRVVAGGQIRLSAPFGTDRRWLEQFLMDREEWIAKNVEKMQGRTAPEKQPPLTAAERKEALAYLQPMVDELYPIVEAYGVAKPRVTVRSMRTRFGSCSVGRQRITLSAMLLQAPKICAEYVVLHELAHFLYPNHSRSFYEFIEKHMPDWKERERILKSYDRLPQQS